MPTIKAKKLRVRRSKESPWKDVPAVALKGKDGASAYEIWLAQGNTGTEADFLESLNGENGKDGKDGKDGEPLTFAWDGTTLVVGSADGTTEGVDLKGEKGVDGDSAVISDVTATVGTGTGTPSVSVTMGGTSKNRTFSFSFDNLKGEKGADADPAQFNETDPTVPSWAKASTKPTYTADEVGAATIEQFNQLSKEIADKLPKNQGAANVGKILVVGSDGNLTLTDMPEGGASGDVTGVLDESNNILLTGNLADGTYTLKYEVVGENGEISYTEIGTLEVGSIVTYTVAQNLTNATSDNAVTAVRKGESITVNLTANDGYNLKSITVTMGGTDITSTAVSGGKVTIASVTGDVVITAVAEEIKVIEPVTVDIGLRDGIRLGSDGGDRTGATGYCATERIDLSDIPKPCTINLTKAKWAYDTTSETGYTMTCARNADGTNLVATYTNTSIGSGYFTVAADGTLTNGVIVTVTSDEVAEICFSGQWANTNYSDSNVSLAAANTKATLTYTPKA